jgi:hypothetical protein
MIISNEQLTSAFLSAQMKCYFRRKLPEVPLTDLMIRLEETLKFLNIAAYCHGEIPVSKAIDEIWHLWILETREYDMLCQSLQGRRFIHHSSNAYQNCIDSPVPTAQDSFEEQVVWLGTYVLNYGPFEDGRIQYWTLAAQLTNDLGWSLSQLNKRLTLGGN